MSRYIKDIGNNKEFAYGHDHAVGYFFDIFDNSPEIDTDEEGHIEGADSLFGFNTGPNTGKPFSNGQMVEVLTEYGVDVQHINAVALDLPF